MTEINLNIPYARMIPEKAIKRFTTHRLEPETIESNLCHGELIDDRYQIIGILPKIGQLKCYCVTDCLNTTRCGSCGADNHQNSTYCDQCGYYIADSKFLLLVSNQDLTKKFEVLIKKNLKHKGILRFFEGFCWHDNCLIVAQNLENKTLSHLSSPIQFDLIMDWLTLLLESLSFLHKHTIFNVALSATDIFIFPDGPRLANFSEAITTNKNVDKWIQSDIQNLAKTFLMILSKIEPDDNNILYLKSALLKAVQENYRTINDFLNEIKKLKKKEENPAPPFDNKKTILLTDKGASISVGMASDVGMVRTLNEDSVGAFKLTNILQSISTPYGFYMVADGMGGHEAGEEASKIAVEYITRKIFRFFNDDFRSSEKKARQILEDAVFAANQEICKTAKARNNNMGTTITVAFLINNKGYILNVGDARAYLYSNKKLKLITQDHSLVYRLYKIGQLKYDEIYNHPQSNQILCALGELNLQQSLDNLAERANHPYFFEITLNKGDGLLLCTDGLWQMIPDIEIEQIIAKYSHPQHAVDELVELANKNGGDDNISLIFVKTH